jgi:tetratricopeptide (TPR) repeat protein
VAGALLWQARPGELALWVDVDGTTLLAGGEPAGRVALAFYAYAVGAGGAVAATLAQGLILDRPTEVEAVRAGGVRFAGRLVLEPDSYSVRVMVRNHDTGAVLLRTVDAVVPRTEAGPLLLPPLFPDPSGAWVLARQQGLDRATAFAGGGDIEQPSPWPVLVIGRERQLALPWWGRPESLELSARLLDGRGRMAAEPLVRLDPAPPATEPPLVVVAATLTPVRVEPGAYTLELVPTGLPRMSRSVPVVVVPEGLPEIWAALDTAAAPRDPLALPPAPADAGPAPASVEEAVARYRTGLAEVAADREVDARATVARLERAVVAAGGPSALEDLRGIERGQALDLAAACRECVLPVVLLHRDLVRSYLRSGEDLLADHSCQLTAELVEELAHRRGLALPTRFGELLLTSLADEVLTAGWVAAATDYLERARRLAPDNPRILLALGAIHERMGRYREAVDALEEHVEVAPASDEGRLRLAVNLARLGHTGEARELLERLLDSSTEGWVTALAYHELARLLVRVGGYSTADEVLLAGIARFPGDRRLTILRAYVLDRQGRALEAGRLVERLEPEIDVGGALPRVRYTLWPSLRLGTREDELSAAAAAQRAALGQAVAAAEAAAQGAS